MAKRDASEYTWPSGVDEFVRFVGLHGPSELFLDPEKFSVMSFSEYQTCYPDLARENIRVADFPGHAIANGMGLECQMVKMLPESMITPYCPTMDRLRTHLMMFNPSLGFQQRGKRRLLTVNLGAPYFCKLSYGSNGMVTALHKPEAPKKWIAVFMAIEFGIQRLKEAAVADSGTPFVWTLTPSNYSIRATLFTKATSPRIDADSELLVDVNAVKFIHEKNPAFHVGPLSPLQVASLNNLSALTARSGYETGTSVHDLEESPRIEAAQTGLLMLKERSWDDVVASYAPLDSEERETAAEYYNFGSNTSNQHLYSRMLHFDYVPPSARTGGQDADQSLTNWSSAFEHPWHGWPDDVFSDTTTPLFFESVAASRGGPSTTRYSLQTLSRNTLGLLKHSSFCDSNESVLSLIRPVIYRESLLHNAKNSVRVSLDSKRGEVICKSTFSLSVALEAFSLLRHHVCVAEYAVEHITRALYYLRHRAVEYASNDRLFFQSRDWETEIVPFLENKIRSELLPQWSSSVNVVPLQHRLRLSDAECIRIQCDVLNHLNRRLHACKNERYDHGHITVGDWKKANDALARYEAHLAAEKAHREFNKSQLNNAPYYLAESLLSTPSLGVAAISATGTMASLPSHLKHGAKSSSADYVVGAAGSTGPSPSPMQVEANKRRKTGGVTKSDPAKQRGAKRSNSVVLNATQSAILAGQLSSGRRVKQENGSALSVFFQDDVMETDTWGFSEPAEIQKRPTMCLLTLLLLHVPEDDIQRDLDPHFTRILKSEFTSPSHRGHWSDYFRWEAE